ncbi:MAG: hypothetical protein AAF575_08210 [Bacteroidota bacterium]
MELTKSKKSTGIRIPKANCDLNIQYLEKITIKIGDGIHATPKYTNALNYQFILTYKITCYTGGFK